MLATALSLVILLVATSQTAGQKCATLYKDNLWSYSFPTEVKDAATLTPSYWNDQISAVRVESGCTITLYEHENYGGAQVTYTEGPVSYNDLNGDGFNDRMSSYKCTCVFWCKPYPCDNGGLCSDVDGSCTCPIKYTGSRCQTKKRVQVKVPVPYTCPTASTGPDCFDYNMDYAATRVQDVTGVVSATACQLLCQKKNGCEFFSYVTTAYSGIHGAAIHNKCHLKSGTVNPTSDVGITSGPATCTDGSTTTISTSTGARCVPHAALWDYNYKTVTGISSIDACIELCLAESIFDCKSIDYKARDSKCFLSTESKLTKPDAFRERLPSTRDIYSYCTMPFSRCSKPITTGSSTITPDQAYIAEGESYTIQCDAGFGLPTDVVSGSGTTTERFPEPIMICQRGVGKVGILSNSHLTCITCPSENYVLFDGVLSVLQGYNLREGDPFIKVDPGFKHSIFDYRVKSESGCDTKTADPALTQSQTVACSGGVQASIYRSYQSFKNAVEEDKSSSGGIQVGVEADVTLEANLSLGGGEGESGGSVGGSVDFTIPPPFQSSWSDSSSMKKKREFFKSEVGSIAITAAECSLWTVDVNELIPPQYTSYFRRALLELNEANHASCQEQKAAFYLFMKTYGTHFFTRMTFGAKISVLQLYSEGVSSLLNNDELKKCNSEDWKLQFGIVGGISESESKCSAQAETTLSGYKNTESEYETFTKGSKYAKNIDDWSESTFTPQPTHFRLAPIVNLLSDKKLKHQEGFSLGDAPRLRQWFVPMYFQYCEAMGIVCADDCDIAYCDECNKGGLTCKTCQLGAALVEAGEYAGTCRRAVCYKPPIASVNISPSKLSYHVGETVTISCKDGYDLIGTSEITCGSDRTWSTLPSCRAKFVCLHNLTIEADKLCDGFNDCGDCSDEDPTKGKLAIPCTQPCKEWLWSKVHVKCAGGNKANGVKYVDIDKSCNGNNECGDCSDELHQKDGTDCKLYEHCRPGDFSSDGQKSDNDSHCDNGNCGWGDGDCDIDSDCRGDLVCGDDNCQYQTGTLRNHMESDDSCCKDK